MGPPRETIFGWDLEGSMVFFTVEIIYWVSFYSSVSPTPKI